MKNLRTGLCVAVFALICVLTILFLNQFTAADSPLLGNLDWEKCEVVDPDGWATLFDPYAEIPPLSEGAFFRFSLRLPETSPALEEGAFLIFENIGAQITIRLDGQELYRSAVTMRGQDPAFQQEHLTLPPDAAGRELTMDYIPEGGEAQLFPPFLRISSEAKGISFYTSASYRNALPAGAFFLGFVLVCAVFLTGLALGSPDWSLILLALAIVFSAVLCVNTDAGYFVFPRRLYLFLFDERSYLIPLALLAVYLFRNRQRTFWRYLGRVSLCTLGAFLVSLLFSSLWQGDLYQYTNSLFHLSPITFLSWGVRFLNIYMAAACSGIAGYSLLLSQLRLRDSARTLTLKNRLMLDNYHIAEESLKRTATMRHEWKNQITTLHLLQKQGDLDGLGTALEQLDRQLLRLSPKSYCENYTVNALLQNTAARADAFGIRFRASAPIPPRLSIDERDLCSFLLNLFNNALTAAANAPEELREIDCTLQIRGGYLAIKCENTYDGTLSLDRSGGLQTTHPDRESHGFGIAQMRAIAKKYDSTLDIHYTADRFTVQTALKLP